MVSFYIKKKKKKREIKTQRKCRMKQSYIFVIKKVGTSFLFVLNPLDVTNAPLAIIKKIYRKNKDKKEAVKYNFNSRKFANAFVYALLLHSFGLILLF